MDGPSKRILNSQEVKRATFKRSRFCTRLSFIFFFTTPLNSVFWIETLFNMHIIFIGSCKWYCFFYYILETLFFFITMYVVGVKFETNLFSKAKMEPEKNLHLQNDRVNLNFGAIHLNIISEMLQWLLLFYYYLSHWPVWIWLRTNQHCRIKILSLNKSYPNIYPTRQWIISIEQYVPIEFVT